MPSVFWNVGHKHLQIPTLMHYRNIFRIQVDHMVLDTPKPLCQSICLKPYQASYSNLRDIPELIGFESPDLPVSVVWV